jgi:MFS family permease
MASTVVAAFGLVLFSVFIDVRSTALDIMFPMFVLAFGLGFGMSQRTAAIAAIVPKEEIGVASSILALARNIAGAFGIALFGTMLQIVTKSNVLSLAQNSYVNLQLAAQNGTAQAMQTFTALIELKAQVDAYNTIFLTAAALLMVGAIASFWLKIPERVFEEPIFMHD